MRSMLGILIGISALITIAAHYLRRGRPWLIYLFKPLTMIFVLGLALWERGAGDSLYGRLISIGLLFSLAGDILLMLPRNYFVAGLLCFLLGHLGYAAAFALSAAPALVIYALLPLLLVGAGMYATLQAQLPAALNLPVGAYIAVIVLMAALASGRALQINTAPAYAAALGALCFLVSDALLAWNRFRQAFVEADALVLGTYYVAQFLIALSIVPVVQPLA